MELITEPHRLPESKSFRIFRAVKATRFAGVPLLSYLFAIFIEFILRISCINSRLSTSPLLISSFLALIIPWGRHAECEGLAKPVSLIGGRYLGADLYITCIRGGENGLRHKTHLIFHMFFENGNILFFDSEFIFLIGHHCWLFGSTFNVKRRPHLNMLAQLQSFQAISCQQLLVALTLIFHKYVSRWLNLACYLILILRFINNPLGLFNFLSLWIELTDKYFLIWESWVIVWITRQLLRFGVRRILRNTEVLRRIWKCLLPQDATWAS